MSRGFRAYNFHPSEIGHNCECDRPRNDTTDRPSRSSTAKNQCLRWMNDDDGEVLPMRSGSFLLIQWSRTRTRTDVDWDEGGGLLERHMKEQHRHRDESLDLLEPVKYLELILPSAVRLYFFSKIRGSPLLFLEDTITDKRQRQGQLSKGDKKVRSSNRRQIHYART